ncbi:hypothetical protein K9L05_00380 [Candidatus Babeliales bacterium]|nr:hypothetical protein [Candidatus Babeliales bacterium]MCF7899091.1 hypothetical protein [Candidatus Babeliales bacterium]
MKSIFYKTKFFYFIILLIFLISQKLIANTQSIETDSVAIKHIENINKAISEHEKYLILLELIKPTPKTKIEKNDFYHGVLSAGVTASAIILLEIVLKNIKQKNLFPALSFLVGIPTYVLSYYLAQTYLKKEINVTYSQLVKNIVKNWILYKKYIPEDFHEKFNLLVEKYNQNQSIKISESESCALLIDLITCLKLKLKFLKPGDCKPNLA